MVSVYAPEGPREDDRLVRAGSDALSSATVVAVLSNRKDNATTVLAETARRLCERIGTGAPRVIEKAHAATPAEDSLLDDLAGHADVILTGSAD